MATSHLARLEQRVIDRRCVRSAETLLSGNADEKCVANELRVALGQLVWVIR